MADVYFRHALAISVPLVAWMAAMSTGQRTTGACLTSITGGKKQVKLLASMLGLLQQKGACERLLTSPADEVEQIIAPALAKTA